MPFRPLTVGDYDRTLDAARRLGDRNISALATAAQLDRRTVTKLLDDAWQDRRAIRDVLEEDRAEVARRLAEEQARGRQALVSQALDVDVVREQMRQQALVAMGQEAKALGILRTDVTGCSVLLGRVVKSLEGRINSYLVRIETKPEADDKGDGLMRSLGRAIRLVRELAEAQDKLIASQRQHAGAPEKVIEIKHTTSERQPGVFDDVLIAKLEALRRRAAAPEADVVEATVYQGEESGGPG
jgi:hypothetical protein